MQPNLSTPRPAGNPGNITMEENPFSGIDVAMVLRHAEQIMRRISSAKAIEITTKLIALYLCLVAKQRIEPWRDNTDLKSIENIFLHHGINLKKYLER